MVSAALVAGNTVVFKPSDAAGLTGRLVVEALVAGGLPDGVLNLVQGGAETGKAIVNHPLVDGLAFTGSNAVGMTMLRHAAAATAMRPVLCRDGRQESGLRSGQRRPGGRGIGRRALGVRAVGAEMQRGLESLCRTRHPRRLLACAHRDQRQAGGRRPAPAGRVHGPGDRRARGRSAGRRGRERPPAPDASCSADSKLADGAFDARPLCPADGGRGPAERPPDQSRRAVRAVPQRAAVRRARRGDRRCQPQRLRPHRRHLHPGPGRARPLPQHDRGRRALRQPRRAGRRPAPGRASRPFAAGRGRGPRARAGSAAGTCRSSCASRAALCSAPCEQALRFSALGARRPAARRNDDHVRRLRPGRQPGEPDPGDQGVGSHGSHRHLQQCRRRRLRPVAPPQEPPGPQDDFVLHRREQAVRRSNICRASWSSN